MYTSKSRTRGRQVSTAQVGRCRLHMYTFQPRPPLNTGCLPCTADELGPPQRRLYVTTPYRHIQARAARETRVELIVHVPFRVLTYYDLGLHTVK